MIFFQVRKKSGNSVLSQGNLQKGEKGKSQGIAKFPKTHFFVQWLFISQNIFTT